MKKPLLNINVKGLHGFLFVFLFGFSQWLLAAEIKGLYEAEVPTFGSGDKQQNEAMQAALLEVLIKVSGLGRINQRPGMSEILANSASYVQQYRYRKWTGEPSEELSAVPTPTKSLWVRFDKQAIDKVLENNQLPIWGRSRPSTLVWLAVEQAGERLLVGASGGFNAAELLREAAVKRGIPMLFPLLDLEDQVNIQVTDVWGHFQEEILRASLRYQTEAILVGSLFQDTPDSWQARWTLYENGQRLQWYSQGLAQMQVLNDGIGRVADLLAEQYARNASSDTKAAIQVLVRDVFSLKDYSRLINYFDSLGAVSNALPINISGTEIVFELKVVGNQQKVIQVIALGNTLVPLSENESISLTIPMKVSSMYRLVP